MENRTLKRAEKERSHDLLQAIFHAQQEDAFISDLKAHRINQKYRVLEQRLHRTSKANPFRHHASLNQRPLKETHLLVKHQNKVEANIELHKPDRQANHFGLPLTNKIASCHTCHADSYFTPKTKQQIVSRHRRVEQRGKFQHKNYNKQSNFSIKLASEATPARLRQDNRIWRRESQCSSSPADRDKENAMKQSIKPETNLQVMMEGSSFQSKCNSFSSFSQCPSRLYGKEKQELVSLDEQVIKKGSQISGFTQHQLFSYYKSLLSFSTNSEGRYVAGFETMLNLMNITTNEATVKQLLAPFIARPSFSLFMEVFERIVESSLRESVVDYFEIVLDGRWTRELCFDELLQLLSERMSKYHAREIVEEVYFQLERDNDQRVGVQDIVALCYRSQDFCSFMRGYCQETQRQRVSLKSKGRPLFS